MHAPVSPFYTDPIEENPLCSADLEETVQTLLTYRKVLSDVQRLRLLRVLRDRNEEEPELQAYGPDFDLAGEVQQQIMAVRAIRKYVMDLSGEVKEGVSVREVREVVTSGSTLLTALMKFHGQVVNLDRMRSLERAVVEVLREVDAEIRDRVMERLEQRLENVH